MRKQSCPLWSAFALILVVGFTTVFSNEAKAQVDPAAALAAAKQRAAERKADEAAKAAADAKKKAEATTTTPAADKAKPAEATPPTPTTNQPAPPPPPECKSDNDCKGGGRRYCAAYVGHCYDLPPLSAVPQTAKECLGWRGYTSGERLQCCLRLPKRAGHQHTLCRMGVTASQGR